MCDLSELSGCELVALASIVAIAISEDKTAEETSLLGAFFTSLGDNLSAIALTKN